VHTGISSDVSDCRGEGEEAADRGEEKGGELSSEEQEGGLVAHALYGHAGEWHSVRLLPHQGRTPDLHPRGGAGHQGLGPGAAADVRRREAQASDPLRPRVRGEGRPPQHSRGGNPGVRGGAHQDRARAGAVGAGRMREGKGGVTSNPLPVQQNLLVFATRPLQ